SLPHGSYIPDLTCLYHTCSSEWWCNGHTGIIGVGVGLMMRLITRTWTRVGQDSFDVKMSTDVCII
ncbi:hypothetical protein J6590_045002, partial [Homalodisca vitripennis]